MGKVKTLTRTTATSAKAIGARVADVIEDYLPEIIDRVVEVDRGSSLAVNIIVKPAGRTEAAKDPEVVITCTPKYGAEAITIKARITGEGDDAQLSRRRSRRPTRRKRRQASARNPGRARPRRRVLAGGRRLLVE